MPNPERLRPFRWATTQSNLLAFSLLERLDSLAVVCQTVGDRLGKNEKTKVVAKLQNPVGSNIQTLCQQAINDTMRGDRSGHQGAQAVRTRLIPFLLIDDVLISL